MRPWREMDASLRIAFASVAASGALLLAGGTLVGGLGGAVSVLAGVALAVSNLYALSRIVRTVILPAAEGAGNVRLAWSVFALGKMMLLFGAVWLLVTSHLVDPMELVAGYASLPIGIAIGAVVSDKVARWR